MGQWNKINNGNLPQPPAPTPKPPSESVSDLFKEIQEKMGAVVHPDIINGTPGVRIKIPL